MSEQFDVIVIGAGAVGENVAGRTAANGLKTVVIERELAGGECSYWACMPSKSLLRPLAVLDLAKSVPGAKEAVTGSVDVQAVLARRDEVVSGYDDASQVKWIEDTGIAFIRGSARLDGEKRVVVTTADGERELLATKAVVLATGSTATMPPINGLADAKPWTNREATGAKVIPKRFGVIGGGVVASELAQAFNGLGSNVTMVVRGDKLLASEEPFVSEGLAKKFDELGIDVRFKTEASAVRRNADGTVQLTLADGSLLEVDELLVAAGRRPGTRGIGLDTVGLEDGGHLEVDDELRVGGVDGAWLYAAGDVAERALLTHMGKYEARVVGDVIAGKTMAATADNKAITQVTFTDPEVAAVGMRLARAKEAGLNVREVQVPISSAAGAYVNGNQDGVAQIVVDEDRKIIVGATFFGPEVAELLHSATVAVVGEVPLDRLWHAVPPYPTVSEVWLRLLEEYGL